MNKDKIKEIILEKTDEIAGLCENISTGFDMIAIHNFRVAFKYLRSFLRLIRMHNDNRGLKMPEKLKELYAIAGYIRDAQVELENTIINRLELPEYDNELNKIIAARKKEWEKCYSNKILQRFSKQINKHHFEELPTGVLSNFLNTRMASIDDNISAETPTDTQIHNVRKQAKDIINASIAAKKKNWKAGEEEIKTVPLQELKHVADEIGTYNDERHHLEHINQYSTYTNDTSDREKLQKISKEQQPKIEKHKKGIIKLVKNLLLKNQN